MTDVLPWIIVLLIIAIAGGYVLGRKAATRTVPSPHSPPATPGSQPVSTTSVASRSNVPSPRPVGGGVRGPEAPPASQSGAAHQSAGVGASAAVASLADVRSWGYQLQHLDLQKAAVSPYDLLVIDYSKDGSNEGILTPTEIDRLKRKPDGGRRFVVAYLSIGEAESYRPYWQPGWKRNKPEWLLGENPEWEENYAVCFWEPGWQNLMCGSPDAYLDRILAQGFDGIYLDKCDVVDDLREHFKSTARSRKDLEGDMVAFVQRLSAYAKAKHPGFVVIMQNAEPLLERPALRAAIDAVGKEELLFGLDSPEKPNTKGEIAWSHDLMQLIAADGKPVFMVEYLDNPAKIREAATEAKKRGYILYVAPKDRELDKLAAAPPLVA